MKNAVVYYSFTHNNEKLARYLGEKLQCEMIRIDTVKHRNGFSIFLDIIFGRTPAIKPLPKSLAAYDHVIFVSPVWAGKIATPLKALLKKQKSLILRYSFVSLCGGAPGQKEKIDQQLLSLVGAAPDIHIELSVNEAIALHRQENPRYTATTYRVAVGELSIYEPQLRPLISTYSLAKAI